jgi:hypothetical protein
MLQAVRSSETKLYQHKNLLLIALLTKRHGEALDFSHLQWLALPGYDTRHVTASQQHPPVERWS